MNILPIKTRIMNPPKDDIFEVLNTYGPPLQEKDILLITSKVISIHQGRCIRIDDVKDKDALIKKEADRWIPRSECPGEYAVLTITDGTLIASAGIDESNANGYYILWPKNSEKIAKEICIYLKKKFSLKDLAIIITDSHTTPLRYGSLGMAMGYYGLEPLQDYRGSKDIFDRPLKMTQHNMVEALAVMGVFSMGEGNEQTPLALIRNAPGITFTERETYKTVQIKEDLYYPLLKNFYNKYE